MPRVREESKPIRLPYCATFLTVIEQNVLTKLTLKANIKLYICIHVTPLQLKAQESVQVGLSGSVLSSSFFVTLLALPDAWPKVNVHLSP